MLGPGGSRWLSDSEYVCVTVAESEVVYNEETVAALAELDEDELYAADNGVSGIEFVLDVEKEQSNELDCGFRYVEADMICDPTCPRRANCVRGQCVCHRGWTGEGDAFCEERAVQLLVAPGDDAMRGVDPAADLVVSEDASLPADEFVLSIGIEPTATVRVSLSVVDESTAAWVQIEPSVVEFDADNWKRGVTIVVDGVYNAVRDGRREVQIKATVESADPEYSSSRDIAQLDVTVLDSSPRVYTLAPDLLPRIGDNVTMIVSDLDRLIEVVLDDETAAVVLSREVVDASDVDVSSLIGKAHPGGRKRQGGAVPTYERLFVALGEATNGYHDLSVVNLGGTMTEARKVLFYTDSCRREGYFGADCKKCPKGGICPGGDRVWADVGYWVEDEETGVVGRCEFEHRCPGGKGAECAAEYQGEFCSQCASGYYPVQDGYCEVCPEQDGVLLYIAADIIMWSLFGVAAALIKDRELFTYCVVAMRALQMISGLGDTATNDTPPTLKKIYEVLKLFSGDYSIIKQDCITPVPYHMQFWMALGHSVAIFIPMFTILFLAKWIVRFRMRKADEIDIRETMNYYADRKIRCVFVAFTLTYLSVGVRSLEALICRPIDGEYRLAVSLETVCFNGTHLPVAIVSGLFLLLVVVGLPVALTFWYRRHPLWLFTNERFMEKYNFFYEQLRPGMTNVFLIEFYIFVTLIFGKAVLQQHPNTQNGILSSGFVIKLFIVVWKRPFTLASDNVIQGLIAVVLLFVTNYNFLTGLGVMDGMRGVSDLLLYTVVGVVAAAFLAVVI